MRKEEAPRTSAYFLSVHLPMYVSLYENFMELCVNAENSNKNMHLPFIELFQDGGTEILLRRDTRILWSYFSRAPLSHTCKQFVTFRHLLMSKVLLTCGTSWKNTSTHLHTTHLSTALFALSRSSYPRDWRTNVSREALRRQQRYPVVSTRKWNTKGSKTGKGDIVVLMRVKRRKAADNSSYFAFFQLYLVT